MNQKINQFCREFDGGKMLANPQSEAIESGVLSVPLPTATQLKQVKLRCDSLRDGIQGTFLSPIEKDQFNFIKLQEELGVNAVTVGIYSSISLNNLSTQDVRTMSVLEYMREQHPNLDPVLVVRAMDDDIRFLEMCLEKNPKLIALVFQGNSPLRRFVQAWGESADVLNNLNKRIKQARKLGVRVMSFTEDAARTPVNELKEYVKAALDADTTWVGIADTVGDLKVHGAYYIVRLVQEAIKKEGESKGIVYHAHNDSNTAIQASLAAIAAGVEWVDVVVNGVGERAGNTDQIQLMNAMVSMLRDYGETIDRFDRSKFYQLAKLFERMTGVKIPDHAPIVGDRAYTTSSGVHADAQLKIERELVKAKIGQATEQELFEYRKRLETVYASVSPAEFGRQIDIRLSPMSGASNVILVLYYLNLITEDQMMQMARNHPVVIDMLTFAKQAGKELSQSEVKRKFNDGNWRLV